jgi:DNA-binding MarR family transcriptional regulator
MDRKAGLELWRRVASAAVGVAGPDLSWRQQAVLLSVYLEQGPHTVRGLSARLKLSKPAVTRALDALCLAGYARRLRDPVDGRSVLVQRTVKGSVWLADFGELIARSAVDAAETRAEGGGL